MINATQLNNWGILKQKVDESLRNIEGGKGYHLLVKVSINRFVSSRVLAVRNEFKADTQTKSTPMLSKACKKNESTCHQKKPKLITGQMVQEVDNVIVMGCSAQGFCPAPMLNKVTEWNLEDPKGKPIEEVREIRDEIEKRVKMLIGEVGLTPNTGSG